MNKVLASLIGSTFLVAASAGHAQTRTWVSGVGDDLNPCSRTAPCKTFAGAISKTAANGEINCLDPGGYGAVTITKSITIDCGWTHGSILAANTNGVIINSAGIVVTLRGLTINGAGTTTGNGIRILNAAAVNIDDLVIENIGGSGPANGRGITIETAANVRVNIQNTRIFNTNFLALHSTPTGGTAFLAMDNVQVARGQASGINLTQNTSAMINNVSVTHFPSGGGITLELSTTSASITNSFLAHNGIGVFNGNAGGAPITRLYHNVITGNTIDGIDINGGQVISLGNNMIQGNAGNQTPSSTIGTQ